MKHVLFKAPVLTQSGYGVHARQVAKALISYVDDGTISLSIVPTQWGNTPWLLRDDMHDGFIGRLKRYCDHHDKHPDMAVQLLLPNEWTPVNGAVNIGMTAGVETDRVNPRWIDCLNSMDSIIVPSMHVKRSFENTGNINSRIEVVPESFIDTLLTEHVQCDLNFDTKFNFLVVGQFTSDRPQLDRKNIINTLRILVETFRNDPDVGIVVKLNSGRSTLIDRKITIDRITQLLKQHRKGNTPHVHVIHGDLSDAEMTSLYRHPSIKALVTLTRGEGFGLPVLEAAAADIPIIATNWSAYLDFLNMGNFIKVNYRLETIPAERVDACDDLRKIWIENAMWAQPNEQNAVQALKRFRMSHEIPTTWARELGSAVREKFSSHAISMQYRNIFDSVLK